MSKKYHYANRRYQPGFRETHVCHLCGVDDVFWLFDTYEDKWNLMDKNGKHRCKHEETSDENKGV